MSRIIKVTLFSVISLALFFYYINFTFKIPIHSDAASVVLMADAMTKGDYFLKDWYLSTGSYYTTEIFLYYLFVSVLGITPLIIKYASAIWLLGVVWCTVFLSGKTREGFKISSSIVTFSLIAIPSQFVAGQILNGPMHISSMLYVLLAFIFLEYVENNAVKYSLFLFLSTVSLVADPFVLWFFVLPMILTSAILWIQERQKKHIYVVLTSVGSYILSKVILSILSFNVPSVGIAKFVEFENIKNNIVLAIKGMLTLYDANIFGGEIASLSTIKSGIHFVLLITIIYLIYNAVKNFSLSKKMDRMYVFLLCAILINFFEYLISNMPVDLGSTRYLFPMLIYITIFIGRYGISKINILGMKKRIVLGIISLIIISTYVVTPFKINYMTENKVATFLVENNLKHGYGSYWNSLNLTVESKGLVNVYPVVSDGEVIMPFRWLSYEKWYNQDVNFIVFSNDNWGQVNKQTVIKSFGEPTEIHKIEQHEIYVWDKSISKKLKK